MTISFSSMTYSNACGKRTRPLARISSATSGAARGNLSRNVTSDLSYEPVTETWGSSVVVLDVLGEV